MISINFLDVFSKTGISFIDDMVNEIMSTNIISESFGLYLSPQNSRKIIINRNDILKGYDRIEVGTEITEKIITQFCSSPYIQQTDYANTIMEIQELFHYIKNELDDSIGDDELIETLVDLYNNSCYGVLELLQGKETEKIIRQFKFGNEDDLNLEEYMDHE